MKIVAGLIILAALGSQQPETHHPKETSVACAQSILDMFSAYDRFEKASKYYEKVEENKANPNTNDTWSQLAKSVKVYSENTLAKLADETSIICPGLN